MQWNKKLHHVDRSGVYSDSPECWEYYSRHFSSSLSNGRGNEANLSHDLCVMQFVSIINSRRACTARVTVVDSVCPSVCLSVCPSVCLSVCLSVCPLSHISPLEHFFLLKTLLRTQWATKVKNVVEFSLKPLRCRDPALTALYSHP